MTRTMTGKIRGAAGVGRFGRQGGPILVLAALFVFTGSGSTVGPYAGTTTAVPPRVVAERAPLPGIKPSVRPDVAERHAQGRTPAGEPSAGQAAALPAHGLEPDALVGLDQTQTQRLLGAPAATEVEREAPAKVWRYARGGCTLKVFFFMDMTSKDFRALSYDMKSSHNVPDDDQRCFAHLVAQAWDGGHE